MIFEAEPEQISRLDSNALVYLMRLLLHAECHDSDVPLRESHVPLQITIPDGGEDGRVEWSGGVSSTAYFPSRYCVFQAKAKKRIAPSDIETELLKKIAKSKGRKLKGRRRKQHAPRKQKKVTYKLNDAIASALKVRGSYILLTTVTLVSRDIDKLKKKIAASIKKGGGNPRRLTAVDVFDANKLANWANKYPSVALWLAERARRRSLSGFQSLEGWRKSADITAARWASSNVSRYVAININDPESELYDPKNKAWTFEEASAAVGDQLARDQHCVRIAGPSGFGKSRFAFEAFNQRDDTLGEINRASVIYADYSIIGDEVLKLGLEIAEATAPSILVVDECPDSIHQKLVDIAHRVGSRLRLLTIDIEPRVLQTQDTLAIRLEPAPKELISEIAKAIDPKIDDPGIRIIQDLANGFPQMAVLAAKQKGKRAAIQSSEQYLNRVLWGNRAIDVAAQRALAILSLFSWVGISGKAKDQAEFIAAGLAGVSVDEFSEHIKSFEGRGVVIYRGDFVQVQPIPLAARLGARQLSGMPHDKVFNFFIGAPDPVKDSMLNRIRWLDTAPEARRFAEALLSTDALGNFSTLNTDIGSKQLDRLVHVVPDLAMSVIDSVFGSLTIDELTKVKAGRRYVVWSLEKLAFRRSTFERAARLLLRLAAAEIEDRISNNATGEFKGLYKLHLSGTEAEPTVRMRVLDDGLNSSDLREKKICIDALDEMLESGHFSRGSGAEEIGSAEPLEDWSPKTYGDIREFYKAALSRLSAIAQSDDTLAGQAKENLGSRIRGMLNQFKVNELREYLDPIIRRDGIWVELVYQVSQWLYFDSAEAPDDIKKSVREYFDELMPNDPVDLAVIYCHGWQVDFHDPDSIYRKSNDATHDYEYASRKSVEVASQIADDTALLDRALERFVASDAKSPFAFSRRLAELVSDPLLLFQTALGKAEAKIQSANLGVFSGIIAGTDRRNSDMARECIRAALASPKLKQHALSLITSNKLQTSDLKLVTSLLQSNDISPSQCAVLAYGRGLEHFTENEINPLLSELFTHGAAGQWTALEIVSMYLHPMKKPGDVLAGAIKKILLSPDLFADVNRPTMDGHHLKWATTLLINFDRIDGGYASRLVRRMLEIIKVKEYRIFHEMDEPVREVIGALIPKFPREAGAEIFKAIETAGHSEVYRLNSLIDSGHRENNYSARLLYALPSELYISWIRKAPMERAHHVADWLPIAIKKEDGTLSWHPDIEAFVDEFCSFNGVLDAVADRMDPSSWWGSQVPHLTQWIPLLEQWREHKRLEVRDWVHKELEIRKKRIAAAKKRDDEDPVRFG